MTEHYLFERIFMQAWWKRCAFYV